MNFQPNPDAMQAFLDHLFGDAMTGRIELAWTDAGDGKLRHAQLFPADELDGLIQKAAEVNAVEGQNCYVGAALRHPDTCPFGRAKDEDFLCAPAFWADLDDGEAVATAKAKYNGAPPTLGVITGRKPHPRAQLWWRHEIPCDDATLLRRQNAALALALSGDPSVVNPSRVMRLPGSIAWPVKSGRVVELVELQIFNDDRPQIYLDGQLAKAFPPQGATATPTNGHIDLGLGPAVDPVAMLRAAEPGNWHNSMRAFAAHCVGAGYPDWIIIEAARQVLDDPADPRDLQTLIDGARKKFGVVDTGKEQAESAPLTVVGLCSLIKMDLPERKTLFGPWLPEQGLVMAFSETGMGKTFFALNVGYAVATAGCYLTWTAAEQRKVLYLDGEMPAATMQERSRAIAGADPAGDLDEWFSVLTPDLQDGAMPDLSTKEGQARVEPHLPENGLLIIDHISAFCRSGVENEAESWLPVQSWLLDLRRRGLSVLLIHHAGKTGVQRGTSRREDVLDTVIALKRPKDYEPEDGARFEIHFTKHRGFAGEDAAPIEAKLDTDGLGRAHWEVIDLGDKQAAEIRELKDDGLSIREIAVRLGISKGKVERRLKQ